MKTPYTYLIGWKDLDKWYYGVRFARNCHPDDLWTKYFTSSKVVQEYREKYGEPNVVEVRCVFNTPSQARLWEEKVIRRITAVKSDRWLNKGCGGVAFATPEKLSEEWKQRIRDGVNSPEVKAQMRINQSKARIGKTHSEVTKKKISESQKGERNHQYGKQQSSESNQKRSVSLRGRHKSDETQQRMRKPKSPAHREKLAEINRERAKKRKAQNETLL
jgi:hypothetical protein